MRGCRSINIFQHCVTAVSDYNFAAQSNEASHWESQRELRANAKVYRQQATVSQIKT
jgi:hypothetical protein